MISGNLAISSVPTQLRFAVEGLLDNGGLIFEDEQHPPLNMTLSAMERLFRYGASILLDKPFSALLRLPR